MTETEMKWVWEVRPWAIHAGLECGNHMWKPGKIRWTRHKDTETGENSRGVWVGNFTIWWGRDRIGYWAPVES